jgi:hypothetical protein
MQSDISELQVSSLVVASNPATTSCSKILDLASSLIQTTGSDGGATVEQMVSLPVTKPNKTQFFRIHPTLHADVSIVKIEGMSGTEVYAVVPGLVKALDNVQLNTLFFGVQRDGSHFLWPVNATSPDGWSRSARQIAVAAIQHWCRLAPNRATSSYMNRMALNCQDTPDWPEEKTFTDLLVLAFGDGHIIDSMDHPVVKEMWLQ